MTNTNQATHTPGPWHIEGGGDQGDYKIVSAAQTCDVATVVYIGDEDDIEENANARLISAAPQLLEALQEIEWLIDGREDIDNEGGPNIFMKIGVAARAAIASATGAQP